MRAWLFVLAVLATFQQIVQVASTNDISESITTSATDIDLVITDSVTNHQSHNSDHTSAESESIGQPDPETLVQIEKNLLSIFGFKKRPIVDRSKIVIPEAMKQLYAQIMGHELVDSVNIPKPGLHSRSANTVRSFTHEESRVDRRFQHHNRFRLFFNLSSIPHNEQLKAAELTLTRQSIADVNKVRHRILVYDIIRPGIKNKREPIFLLVDTKTVQTNGSGTIDMDILPAVDRWLRNPKENYGIIIDIVSGKQSKPAEQYHVRLKRSVGGEELDWQRLQPLLFTYTDDGRQKQRSIRDVMAARNRRAPSRRAHKRKDGREICQRRPLYVDFSNVGWSDWIVAPPGYDAFYCHGECPFPIADHLNSTNHAVVQTLVNSIDRDMAPKACCVPTQLNPISMLYLDDQNKVVLKNYQDMAVVGCGCR